MADTDIKIDEFNLIHISFKVVEHMIKFREDRIIRYNKELKLLYKRRTELVKNKQLGYGRKDAIKWNLEKVRSLLNEDLPRAAIAKQLKVSTNALNGYIYRCRKNGIDI